MSVVTKIIPEIDVHPVVAGDQVSVISLPVLEFYEHRVIDRRPQQRQRENHLPFGRERALLL